MRADLAELVGGRMSRNQSAVRDRVLNMRQAPDEGARGTRGMAALVHCKSYILGESTLGCDAKQGALTVSSMVKDVELAEWIYAGRRQAPGQAILPSPAGKWGTPGEAGRP